MTDFDVDQLLRPGPQEGPDSAFEDRLRLQSTLAFNRQHTIRRQTRRALLSVLVLLVAGIAFMGGRLSVHPQTAGDREFVQVIPDQSGAAELYSPETAAIADNAQWYGYTDDSGNQWLIEGVRVVPASFN